MSNKLVNRIVEDLFEYGEELGLPDKETLTKLVKNSVTAHEADQRDTFTEVFSKSPEDVKADIEWYLRIMKEADAAEKPLWAYLRSIEYRPQQDVAGMMHIFSQEVRPLPKMIEDPKERLLAANLVLEESLEFCKALGFVPIVYEDNKVELILSGSVPDLVGAVDGIGDVLVVTYGAANRLGIRAKDVFAEVDRSNKTKIFPDGTIHRRESDGKVLKPDTYSPANIESVVEKQAPLEYATV